MPIQRVIRRGATMVEYAILLMLIAVGATLAILQFGGAVRDLLGGVTNTLPGGGGEEANAPSVVAVLPPAPGVYEPGDVLTYVVRFSEPVVVTRAAGVPDMPVTIGGTTRAAEDDGTGSGDIRYFTYTVQESDPKPSEVAVGPRIDPDGDTITTADAGEDVDLRLPQALTDIEVAERQEGPFDVMKSASAAYPRDQSVRPDGGWFLIRNIPYLYSFAPDGSLEWAYWVSTSDGYPEYNLVAAAASGGAYIAGSSGDDHTVAHLDANGNLVWARRFTIGNGDLVSLMQTPDGDVVVVGHIWDYGGARGFIVRLTPDGDLETALTFRNSEDTGTDRDTWVTAAETGPYQIGIAGGTGDGAGAWYGGYFLTIPTDFGAALSGYQARAIYQRTDLGTFGRDRVRPTALAHDGARWWYVAEILTYPEYTETPFWLVQELGGGLSFGPRSIYEEEIPTAGLAVLDQELLAAGGIDTDGDGNGDRAALYEFDYGSGVYIDGRTLSDETGSRQILTVLSRHGGGVLFGGGVQGFTDSFGFDLLVGRIGRLSGFQCESVGTCDRYAPLTTGFARIPVGPNAR